MTKSLSLRQQIIYIIFLGVVNDRYEICKKTSRLGLCFSLRSQAILNSPIVRLRLREFSLQAQDAQILRC